MDEIHERKLRRCVMALALLACLAALYDSSYSTAVHNEESRQLHIKGRRPRGTTEPTPEEFSVCGRTATFHRASWSLQQQHYNATGCPLYDPAKPTLELKGRAISGRTGNEFRTFLRAMQYARDKNIQLGLTHNSWAANALLQFFMADNDGDANDDAWKSRMEESLCVKILQKSMHKRMYGRMNNKKLFYYKTKASPEEYVASQLQIIRTLFQHHNTGVGVGHTGKKVKDMCSGINALFNEAGKGEVVGVGDEVDHRSSALYSVIHVRYFEGHGAWMLRRTANRTGCDPVAAQEMTPEYIKAILAPQGMLKHPIVIITDNQRGSKKVISRLRGDPDLGPMLHLVPKEACWLGGDMMLAVMANVFIGHPSSTMSGFIARSRVALGFEQNYMYLARDDSGTWNRVHGVLGETHATSGELHTES